jgi:Fic family protein
MISMYTSPFSMSPLLPRQGTPQMEALSEKASALIYSSYQQHCPQGIAEILREALRPMNSYYTNKIEGQHTTPLLIAQAMSKDFSARPDEAQKQRAALACMQAEAWAEGAIGSPGVLPAAGHYFGSEYICSLHHAMYQHLSMEDRMAHGIHQDGSAWAEEVIPGQLRKHDVQVGLHIPPSKDYLPAFMDEFHNGYRFELRGERAVIAILAAHHRLAWIHPFGDGNGRTIRLHTHSGLHALGLTKGIWSPMRGLARNHARYNEVLARADLPREGDQDGRGNLSEKHFIQFIDFMLDTCLDQVSFMNQMLEMTGFEERLHKMLMAESVSPETPNLLKLNSLLPLKYLLHAGQMPKQDFKAMLGGDSDRTQSRVIKDLTTLGILKSESLHAPYKLAFPIKLFRYLFPGLWVEAESGS